MRVRDAARRHPQDTTQHRSATVDVARGIGITLVVIGHVIRGLDPSSLPQMVLTVDTWIYSFHMPLFFILSGLFIERSVRGSFPSVLGKKTATIVYPYLLWSVLQEIVRAASGARNEGLGSVWTILYEPVMQFWFLYVLFVGTMLYALLRRVGLQVETILALASLLYLTKLLRIDVGDWSVFYLFRSHFIYLALGALLTRYSVPERVDRVSLGAAAAYVAVGFGGVTLATALSTGISLELPVALAGSAATIFLARSLTEVPLHQPLAFLGVASFEIYVAHTIFSAAAREMLDRVLGTTPLTLHLVVGIAAGILGPLVVRQLAIIMEKPWVFRAPTAWGRARVSTS